MSVNAPDLVGTVYGVRSWNADNNGILMGWIPGENIAACRAGATHIAPDENCMCGLYAYYGVGRFKHNGVYGEVVGLVKGWGKVSVARDGWRAQYAEVVAIAVESPNASLVGMRYDVPVLSLNEIDVLARNNTVPPELRPNPTQVVEPPVRVAPNTFSMSAGGPPPRPGNDQADVLRVTTLLMVTAIALVGTVLGAPLLIVLPVWIGFFLGICWAIR